MDELAKAVEAMQSGDDSAFQTIYSATYKRTLSVIRKYCNDADAYDDLLQDIYIQFYNHIGQIKDPSAVQAWLNTTAGRIAKDYGISHSKHQTKPLSELEDEDGNPVEIEDENEAVRPELIADRKALTEIVNQVLELLPAEQREALLMVYGQKTTIREMAAKRQVSENTIKSRLYQGRQKLMAHKADFRRLGVELPAVGIATVIAVAFEENMAAQAAVGAAAGAVFANTSAGAGMTAGAVSGSAALSSATASAAAGGSTVSAGAGTAGGAASGASSATINITTGTAASGASAASGSAAASAGTATAASSMASTSISSTASSAAASGAAAAAGTKAAAAGMSIGVKAVIGLVSAAVIAGGGAGAVKTMVIDKQAGTQNETVAEETAETDAADNAQDEAKLNPIHEPDWLLEDLNLTPNQIVAKYGEPDEDSIDTGFKKLFGYADKSYCFNAISYSGTYSNDDPYDVMVGMQIGTAFGITDKVDISELLDAIGGKVSLYHYWSEENGEEYISDASPWCGNVGQTSVVILSENDIVYELYLDDPSIVDPGNIVTATKITANAYVNSNYAEDNTAEFYDYLTTYGYTGLNDGAASDTADITDTTDTIDTTSASESTPAQTTDIVPSAADKTAANAENIKAYYAMIQSDKSFKYMYDGRANGIEALQWQLADIDGDGTDEIMFAFGSINTDSVGIGKMIDGTAVFIGSAGRAGAIAYYPGTGYIHEDGYGAGGFWEALYVINGSQLIEDAFVDYSRDYSPETDDMVEKLYETRLKGVQIPIEIEQDNEAVKYIEQFRQSHGYGEVFYYDDPENHTYEELKAMASR